VALFFWYLLVVALAVAFAALCTELLLLAI
jgi:hypothetical protein